MNKTLPLLPEPALEDVSGELLGQTRRVVIKSTKANR